MPNSRTRAQWPASGIDLVRPSAKRRAEACTARTPQCDREGLKRTFLILAWQMPERHPEIQFPVTRDSCPAEECHRLRLRLGSGRPTCPGLGSQSSIRRALSAYQSSGSYRFDRMKAQLTSATLPE